jgi:hypothetical protein
MVGLGRYTLGLLDTVPDRWNGMGWIAESGEERMGYGITMCALLIIFFCVCLVLLLINISLS